MEKYEMFLKRLFVGKFFEGFEFKMFFCLLFTGETSGGSIAITILSDWYIGLKESWKQRVLELQNKEECVQPDEPLAAFELAKIRWSKGAKVTNIKLDKMKFQIFFESGQTITIENQADMDSSWYIQGHENNMENSTWKILCEDSELYITGIENIDEADLDV